VSQYYIPCQATVTQIHTTLKKETQAAATSKAFFEVQNQVSALFLIVVLSKHAIWLNNKTWLSPHFPLGGRQRPDCRSSRTSAGTGNSTRRSTTSSCTADHWSTVRGLRIHVESRTERSQMSIVRRGYYIITNNIVMSFNHTNICSQSQLKHLGVRKLTNWYRTCAPSITTKKKKKNFWSENKITTAAWCSPNIWENVQFVTCNKDCW